MRAGGPKLVLQELACFCHKSMATATESHLGFRGKRPMVPTQRSTRSETWNNWVRLLRTSDTSDGRRGYCLTRVWAQITRQLRSGGSVVLSYQMFVPGLRPTRAFESNFALVPFTRDKPIPTLVPGEGGTDESCTRFGMKETSPRMARHAFIVPPPPLRPRRHSSNLPSAILRRSVA